MLIACGGLIVRGDHVDTGQHIGRIELLGRLELPPVQGDSVLQRGGCEVRGETVGQPQHRCQLRAEQ
ncbi:Uncharacterised protein [Mycobacteroides abscessus subsp. massiliense]|nr:Uncharacterised protein [Mycobacteroides abscessus subsp. massiliense]